MARRPFTLCRQLLLPAARPDRRDGQTCFGTASNPGDQNDSHEFTQGLDDPLTRGDLYTRISYDLSPNAEVFATLNMGQVRTENMPAQGNSSKSGELIRCDNAYLLQSGLFNSAAVCASAVNGAAVGTQTAATEFAATMSFGSDWADIPTDQLMFINRTMRRYVVGGDGTFDLFSKTWSWDSYFQHGESDTSIKIDNMPLSQSAADPLKFSRQRTASIRASTWRRTRCTTRPARSSAATPSPSPSAVHRSIPSAAPA